MGAIFTDSGRLTRMSTDLRAMRPHDLLSVVVSESLAASTDGEVKNSRASNASSQVTSLLGQLHAGNALLNLVNQNSAAGLNAQGQSVTSSSLAITLGGEVVDVLPNEFAQGTTKVVQQTQVDAQDKPVNRITLKQGATVDDLVGSLQRIGATARDVISILQAMKSANARRGVGTAA